MNDEEAMKAIPIPDRDPDIAEPTTTDERSGKEMTFRQLRFVERFFEDGDEKAAAEAAGVQVPTVKNWLRDTEGPVFTALRIRMSKHHAGLPTQETVMRRMWSLAEQEGDLKVAQSATKSMGDWLGVGRNNEKKTDAVVVKIDPRLLKGGGKVAIGVQGGDGENPHIEALPT